MGVAVHQDVCATFFDRLRTAPSRALLLDYDGTLAPFTPDREHAFSYPEIPELVARIMRTGTRVVLVSGRPATELLFLSGIRPHPEVWGSHGAERLLPDGSYQVEPPSPDHQSALKAAVHSLHACGFSSNVEVKPGGIAVHWRGVAPIERALMEAEIRNLFASAIEDHGLHLLPFDGGLELRAAGKNKGAPVSGLLHAAALARAGASYGTDPPSHQRARPSP